jgi:hypothetical protein
MPLRRAPNGATMMNAQPLPLLLLEVALPLPTTAGLPLPTTAGPDRLPCGALVLLWMTGAGLAAGGGGWYVAGAAVVGGGAGAGGAGTDET